MRIVAPLLFSILVSGCGKPSGISDEDYTKYQQLGAPKILYSCTTTGVDSSSVTATQECLKISDPKKQYECITDPKLREKKTIVEYGYTAGVGMNATYNKILGDAQSSCGGELKVIESKQ